MNLPPWKLHLDLTSERLILIGQIIRRSEDEAALDHHPEKGEDAWVLGCSSYRRTIFEIERRVDSLPWLRIVTPPAQLYFVFSIGAAPVRFFHGLHDAPQDGRRYACYQPELHQLKLALEGIELPDVPTVFRLIVEKDPKGKARSIFFAQVSEGGEVLNSWEIPAEEVRSLPTPLRREGVELPPPTIGEQPALPTPLAVKIRDDQKP